MPDNVALPKGTKPVEGISVGMTRVIVPNDHLRDTFFDGPAVNDDFMEELNQPEIQKWLA